MYMDKDRFKGFGRVYCGFSVALMCFCMFPVAGHSQSQATKTLEEYSIGGLLEEAGRQLTVARNYEEYGGALPFLEEYLKRMAKSDDRRVQAMVQSVRYKTGMVYFYMDYHAKAATYLDEYLKNKPVYSRRQALKLLAVSQYKSARYEECVATVLTALSEPPIVVTDSEEEKLDTSNLTRKERGGYSDRTLQRFEKLESTARTQIVAKISDEPEPEQEYTQQELVILHMAMAESYSMLKQWEKSVASYTYVIDNTESSEQRGYAMMQLVKALIGQGKFDEAQAYVAALYLTEARYDVRVNAALMTAGQALFDAEKYDGALMLYRMIMPRNELVRYQEDKMNSICLSSGLPEVAVIVVTNQQNKIETLFGIKNGVTNEYVLDVNPLQEKVDWPSEILSIQDTIRTILNLPAYEDEALYSIGLVYARSGRPWEAVEVFEAVIERTPASEMGQRALYEQMMILVEPLKEYCWVEKVCRAYLKDNREGLLPRQLAYVLSGAYQKQDQMGKIKELFPIIKDFVPYSVSTGSEKETLVFKEIRMYEAELYFMQAVADLILVQYEQAEIGFSDVMANYSESRQAENATYWHAVTLLFLQKYQEALDEFEAYGVSYPTGTWLADCSFRGGVCLFSMEKYNEAKERFTYVIKNYRKSDVFPDACSLRGDLYAAETNELGAASGFDAAVADYRMAISSANKVEQATYAVFQLATLLEANVSVNKAYLKDIVDLVTAYLNKYEGKADVAKAVFWIGKTKLSQGLKGEAVTMYLDTILKYGGDIKQDGVDSIINDLAKLSRSLDSAEIQSLKSRLQDGLAVAGNETLKLRLRVLISKIDRTERELGKVLLVEQKDLTKVPPPVLALICDASFEMGNYSRAGEILRIFQGSFDDSEFMGSAYKLRAYDLFNAKDEAGAMKVIQDAQGLYGRVADMAWSQIMKGRILLSWKDYDAARETFMDVLKERAWRGESYPQATFYLGATEEAAGNLKLAFAWYQRTYVQYKGLAKGYWAAEGYLASARVLQKLGLENDRRNTFRAMLFDKYVNTLPQAEEARKELGAAEVEQIRVMIETGVQPDVTISVEGEVGK